MQDEMNYRETVPKLYWAIIAITWLWLAGPMVLLFLPSPLEALAVLAITTLYCMSPAYVSAIACQKILIPKKDYLSPVKPQELSDHQRYTIPTAWLGTAVAQALVAILWVIPVIHGDSSVGGSFAIGGMPFALGASMVPGCIAGLLLGLIATICVRRKRRRSIQPAH